MSEATPSAANKEAKPSADAAAAKPASGPALPVVLGAIIGALALGALSGAWLIGPRLVAARTSRPHAEPDKGHEGKAGKDENPAKSSVFRVDNIIVNPAGSQGTRFLMVSVAVEVPDEKVASRLRDHEVQIRDAIISALEGESLERLTQPGARDRVRERLATTIARIASTSGELHVYLPQFVIQ